MQTVLVSMGGEKEPTETPVAQKTLTDGSLQGSEQCCYLDTRWPYSAFSVQ